jgi:hypothetical protein
MDDSESPHAGVKNAYFFPHIFRYMIKAQKFQNLTPLKMPISPAPRWTSNPGIGLLKRPVLSKMPSLTKD